MKLTGTGVVAIVGVVAGVVGIIAAWPSVKALFKTAATKLNPASRENVVYQATGEIGTKIPDAFGGIFKSSAEKKVDAMLKGTTQPQAAPSPTKKKPITPAGGPVVFGQGGYYDLGQKLPPVSPVYTPGEEQNGIVF